MYDSDRREKILALIKERRQCSVHMLAKELYVSEPTIRRDLARLAQEGKLKRTYGGAVFGETINYEVPLELRQSQSAAAKKKMAEKAAGVLCEGQTVFLDASSSASYLIPHLAAFHNLTVLTNGPKTALMLAQRNIRTICTGGQLLNQSLAFVGANAVGTLSCFNPDIAFFSSRGLSLDGRITDSSLEETMFRRAVLRYARVRVFLCISDKLGSEYACNLCTLDEIEYLVSDAVLPPALCGICHVL